MGCLANLNTEKTYIFAFVFDGIQRHRQSKIWDDARTIACHQNIGAFQISVGNRNFPASRLSTIRMEIGHSIGYTADYHQSFTPTQQRALKNNVKREC